MSDESDLRQKLQTFGNDPRYPNQNQTHRCFTSYVDYYRCVAAKGEDFAPCKEFFRTFSSLCPVSWVEKWDGQRDDGTFPAVDL